MNKAIIWGRNVECVGGCHRTYSQVAYRRWDLDNFETEPSQKEKYDDLFAKMETELYSGCQKFSSLNFLAKLMNLKVLNNGRIDPLIYC